MSFRSVLRALLRFAGQSFFGIGLRLFFPHRVGLRRAPPLPGKPGANQDDRIRPMYRARDGPRKRLS
jgi:hypothetical protein